MKIKTDFVTNSSSSSFVVFWPHEIKTKEDVSMFIKRSDFVDVIFADAMKQKAKIVPPIEEAKSIVYTIADEIDTGYLSEIDDNYSSWDYEKIFCKKHGITEEEVDSNPQWRQQMWQEQDLKKKEKCIVVATKIVKQHEGKYVYLFHYGDEDGALYSDLEHQNNWGGQDYVHISKH